MKRIKVLIADDHKIVRMGLAALFASEKDIEVVGEADDGESVVDRAIATQPDVIIMDLMMPRQDGIVATEKIKQKRPESQVIVLTSYNTSDKIAEALKSGASGALLKTASDSELIEAIRKVSAGGKYVSEEVQKLIETDPPVAPLTSRQMEVLQSLARGLTNKDIASQLCICEQRVEQHIRALLEKLEAANRSEAVAIALRKHLLKI